METLQYNTKRTRLIIPEYGRHVQLMINQILETQDREERNKMASAVIGIMGNMNPHLRDVPDFQHKLWDQLFNVCMILSQAPSVNICTRLF